MRIYKGRDGFKGGRKGGDGRLFFAITCFLLFKVELIIDNAPLTCIYPNSIETCLTLNHLLLGRQLLYSPNTRELHLQ